MPAAADVMDVQFRSLNPAYPRSWWPVAFASDVPEGQAIPARLFERDVVLWREADGGLHCMAAHCPHLGAHLGKGGQVVGDQLRCPFHGWGYDPAGRLASCPGPRRPRQNLAPITSYRVIERYATIFLWNGPGEPDIEFPDMMAEVGLDESEVVFFTHRYLLPYPAKHFAENIADGAHFAVAHDTGGWSEAVIREQTPTYLHFEHLFHDTRPWFGWENVRRRIRKREISNLLAPVVGDLTIKTWGGGLSLISLTGSNALGARVFGWAPVEADSHYFMETVLMPRVQIPVLAPALHKVLDKVLNATTWSVLRQDAPIMLSRHEPANPPYSADDQTLVAYRRLWDSRIDAAGVLDGNSPRHYGLRAGIRPPRPAAVRPRRVPRVTS